MRTITFSFHHNDSHLRFCINRPNALNAINFDVMNELDELLTSIESKPLKVVELYTPANGYLASGGDIKAFSELHSFDEGFGMATKMADILNRFEQLEAITIVNLTGTAFGGGCEFMLAFDLIYSTPIAQLGFTQANFNLPPGWNGSARLVNKIGMDKSLDILLHKRILSAEQAFHIGIISRLFDSSETLQHEINTILNLDLEVLHSIKKSLQLYKNPSKVDLNLKQEELRIFAKAWEKQIHHDAVDRFLLKKKSKKVT